MDTGKDIKMSDDKKDEDELETLFKVFDKEFKEFEQKFSDLKKDLEESRKGKNTDEE